MPLHRPPLLDISVSSRWSQTPAPLRRTPPLDFPRTSPQSLRASRGSADKSSPAPMNRLACTYAGATPPLPCHGSQLQTIRRKLRDGHDATCRRYRSAVVHQKSKGRLLPVRRVHRRGPHAEKRRLGRPKHANCPRAWTENLVVWPIGKKCGPPDRQQFRWRPANRPWQPAHLHPNTCRSGPQSREPRTHPSPASKSGIHHSSCRDCPPGRRPGRWSRSRPDYSREPTPWKLWEALRAMENARRTNFADREIVLWRYHLTEEQVGGGIDRHRTNGDIQLRIGCRSAVTRPRPSASGHGRNRSIRAYFPHESLHLRKKQIPCGIHGQPRRFNPGMDGGPPVSRVNRRAGSRDGRDPAVYRNLSDARAIADVKGSRRHQARFP
jgi:hypothetical protein